ncbi:MAG: hypothetical protein NC822_03210 [Candidatus Omnitrophica bacterium]|nr:hypothetical protein [Candidatus Omnitrophota bacterium]MCM8826341.1 hypothetical protein [Candidatus Omnitrophota bacterium]
MNGKFEVNRGLFLLFIFVVLLGLVFFWQEKTAYRRINGYLEQWNSFLNRENKGLNVMLEKMGEKISQQDEIIHKQDEKIHQQADSIIALSMERDKFRGEAENLQSLLAQLKEELDKVKEEKETYRIINDELNKELYNLKEEIRLWSGRINSLGEVKEVLRRKKLGMRELSSRVREFKDNEQEEKDRLGLKSGNNGYLIRDGKSTLISKKVIDLEEIVVEREE